MIKLKDLLEVKFRKSNKYIHLADLPMFSIYIDKKLSQEKLEAFKKTNYTSEFAKARNTIHKIGFPSMHANVVITDLSKDINPITGGGVAGWASSWKRYMELDPLQVVDSVIVHEWAHLWMDNNGKEFIKAVGAFYSYLQKKAVADMTPALELQPEKLSHQEENKILDEWSKVFQGLVSHGTRDAAQSMYILKIRKSVTPDMFRFLPHLLQVNGVLKQNITGENLSGYRKEILAGEEVYAEKVNDGWIIGKRGTERCERVIPGLDKIFQYVDSKNPGSNILIDIQDALKQSFARRSTRLGNGALESEILKKIKYELKQTLAGVCEIFQSKSTPEDIALVESWAQQYVYPKYIQILRNKKLLFQFNDKPKESYDFLWVLNDLKPDGVSFLKLVQSVISKEKIKKSKLTLANSGSFDSPEYGYYRDVMKHLNKWTNSYGMANRSELWATAIEWFFSLPQNHRKSIIKLMMGMGAT